MLWKGLFSSLFLQHSSCVKTTKSLSRIVSYGATTTSCISTFATTNTPIAAAPMDSIFPSSGFVDVHAHIIHPTFAGQEDTIAQKCAAHGLDYVLVNGLEPTSNRAVLELCRRHTHLIPAIGIYPMDAACNVISDETWEHLHFSRPVRFDVDKEVEFIDEMASKKEISAIGECGLDSHYLKDDITLGEQRRVLRKLMKVAVKHSLPMILHSRKAERMVFEMLLEEKVEKADFHCYCRNIQLAKEITNAGYFISIPSAIVKSSSSFRKLVKSIPLTQLITETDSPYMGPINNEVNDPTTVLQSIPIIAQLKQVSSEEAKLIIRDNFRRLIGV